MVHKSIKRFSEKETKYVMEVLESEFRGSKNTNMNGRFETAFAKKFGMKYAISHVNGTCTMHSALEAAKIGIGDEVIVPPLTMSSTTFVVLHSNAIPIFADVDPNTFQISPESIEKCITPKSKAIIPVSLYGLCPDMDKINKIAKDHNLIVIEDNAQNFLGKYKGRLVGTLGNMSSFSFQSSKHMTSGEGGILLTNDLDLANNIRGFQSLGYAGVGASQGKITKTDIQDPNYSRHVMLGWNYRMPDLCAAVCLGQLEHLDELVQQRIDVAKEFLKITEKFDILIPQVTPSGYENSYWTFVAKINPKKVKWHQFRDKFLENGGDGIYAAWKLTYKEPMFQNKAFMGREKLMEGRLQDYTKPICPNAEEIQPKLLQFRTNYWDWDRAEKNFAALEKTLKFFNK